MTHILLAGNPNSGKTTLFNLLTGANQRVGNWPGVTVEKKTGFYNYESAIINVTDLPGVYSLSTPSDLNLDEQIAAAALISSKEDTIINVVDACHLERQLYLTSQILELGRPTIIVLTMMDLAHQQGIHINEQALAHRLNCPVVSLLNKSAGLRQINKLINARDITSPSFVLPLPKPIKKAQKEIEQLLASHIPAHLIKFQTLRLLEGNKNLASPDIQSLLKDNFDILLADARYQYIHQLVACVEKREVNKKEHFTARLDQFVLHRYLALPLFLSMMYLMFLFSICIGGAFQDFFDLSSEAIFVQGLGALLAQLSAPPWLIAVIANGIGKGINTTLTFIPVIAALFFFLSLLESSGYMARAAFVVDRILLKLGLPGKAFVPMIVGFGCNVPAVMAARILESKRDRLLTILMSPFMSCSARLAIYAVFVAAFFPSGGQNVVFSLYIIGIIIAVLTGFIVRNICISGKPSPLILELPTYHKPHLPSLIKETRIRLRHFVVRAGRLIIPVCVILGGLNAITLAGDLANNPSSETLLSWIGRELTPLFSPMGLREDNWPATVGLLTGMLAKEVVIGSLNSLYAQLGHLSELPSDPYQFISTLKEALWSIPENISNLGSSILHPLLANTADSDWSRSVYGLMATQFDGKVGAYAYLLFILLYIPCVSTMAVIKQETNRQWMWFSIIWSLIVAYFTAVLFYQAATFFAHPYTSAWWIMGILMFIGGGLYFIKSSKLSKETNHAIADL